MKTKLQFKLFFSLLLFSVFLSYSQCNTPTGIIVDGVTGTTVTLFWEDNNDPQAPEWELEYGEIGFVQGTGSILTSTSNVTTISGLLSGTQYDVYIRTVCDVNDSSSWSNVTNFNTLASCITPTNLTLDDVSETTAILFWSDINTPSATDWEIEYGLSGFTQGTGTTLTVTSNVTTIYSLLAGTEYDVYVRSICEVNDLSFWTNIFTFTTSFPPPACGGMFFDSGGLNNNYSNDENITTIICPDNASEIVTVSFINFLTELGYDKLTIYDGNSSSSPMIGIYEGANSPGVISANIANGGCLTFVFTSDFTVNRDGWEANVTCDTLASCLFPTSLTLDDVTDSTATLYWSENNNPPATEWEVEYGEVGFVLGTGTIIAVSSNLITISGLQASTAYNAYVRAICSENDVSNSSEVLTFVTNISPPICGGVFVDTGNIINNYLDLENYTTTITPENAGDIVTVDFTFFNVESGYDGLMIFDGPDVTYPLISSGSTFDRPKCPNGAWTGNSNFAPTSITSTDSSGALTFVFTSDFAINRDGWEADITCTSLGVSENSFNSILVYPNPAKDLITVALKDFQTDVIVKIYSIQGQEVHKELDVNGATDINISNLSSGVYFINILDNKKIFTKKFIKE